MLNIQCISLCMNHISCETPKIVLIEKTSAMQFLLLTSEKSIQTRVTYMLNNLYVHLIHNRTNEKHMIFKLSLSYFILHGHHKKLTLEVALRYFKIHFTAFQCSFPGLAKNLLTTPTACVMSGCVHTLCLFSTVEVVQHVEQLLVALTISWVVFPLI